MKRALFLTSAVIFLFTNFIFAQGTSINARLQQSLKFYESGKSLYKSEKLEQSLEQFKKALQLDPENEMVKLYIDKIYFETDPEYSVNKMLTRDTEKIDVLVKSCFNKGKALYEKNEVEKAVNIFLRLKNISVVNKLSLEDLYYTEKAQIDWEKIKLEKKLRKLKNAK